MLKDKIASEVGHYYVDDSDNEVGSSKIKDLVGRHAKEERNIRKKSIVKIKYNQARGVGAHFVCVSSSNPRSKLGIVLFLKFFALSIFFSNSSYAFKNYGPSKNFIIIPATYHWDCSFLPKFVLHPIKIEEMHNVFPVLKLWHSKAFKLEIPSFRTRHSEF
ncbi:hypothetical protein M9H77_17278 [Catharanthus roseus]|uniref:Uncharacterized protein n=1 Tax=Catharanthus roseus TaxID=4058 RepID=A0ACC0B455_CATRO|nr:hypothetical protein M9H77_17278 [Catharanthus roseus]